MTVTLTIHGDEENKSTKIRGESSNIIRIKGVTQEFYTFLHKEKIRGSTL